MDQSRRAVESYWRSRMIDGATSEEDKVTPVYKLEEICELLRSSHVSIVKEVSEFILKRLQHKSPLVKQKALRVIKYAVGKSGAEFRREMQRNSISVRQLIHYKGHPDPLKGDALNKAVRETAQEALSAIFSAEDNKPAPTETLGGRIQGFGNTNFEMPSQDKKSFLDEVVGIGSATIKQGLSSFTQSPSTKKNDTGSYRSPNLRRSLTMETDYSDRYEGISSQGEKQSSSRFQQDTSSGNWSQDLRSSQLEETADGDKNSSLGPKSHEERLLDTIVTSGGVRLQPTRDALQAFIVEVSKLDALSLSRALELKLQYPQWQVRMKAVCVLEALLRNKDGDHFPTVESYFSENQDVVVKCSESPQASLREKANKVLNLLGGGQSSGAAHLEKQVKAEATSTHMPDLIDTGDSDDIFKSQESLDNNQSTVNPPRSAALVDDLFADILSVPVDSTEQKNEDDPFADVSFHSANNKEHEADLFSGMIVDKSGTTAGASSGSGHQFFDVFGYNSDAPLEQGSTNRDVNDLMASLSVNENNSFTNQNGSPAGTHSNNILGDASAIPTHQVSNNILNSPSASQKSVMNANHTFPLGAMAYNIPPGFMLNPALASQPMNYNAMGSLLAQQQFLATMSNFQQLGHFQANAGVDHSAGLTGGYSSPLPDIFNPGMTAQAPTSMANNTKKEETKAFDFISDHLAAARDPKRVI